MKKFITGLLVLTLIFCSVAECFALDYDNFTRGDFFELVAETLLLEGEEAPLESFPDYNGELPLINAMINKGYLLGRTDGTLSLDKELCIADVEYLFSRFDLSPKTEEITVEKTEKDLVPVPVPIPLIIPISKGEKAKDCETENDHLYQFATDHYECIYCHEPAPVGTNELACLDEDYYSEDQAWDELDLDDAISCYGSFDAARGIFCADGPVEEEENENEVEYPIDCPVATNAICFYEGERIGYAEMFRENTGEDQSLDVTLILSDETFDGTETNIIKAINITGIHEEEDEDNLLFRLFRW